MCVHIFPVKLWCMVRVTCVYMTCHENFTCVSGIRITLSISWGLGWFPSLCECHQGQQSSYYVSKVESGQMGTVWKLPVILLMVPAWTCCIPLKRCGLPQLHSPHSISKQEIHTRSRVLQEMTAAALSTDSICVQVSQSLLQQGIIFARIMYNLGL